MSENSWVLQLLAYDSNHVLKPKCKIPSPKQALSPLSAFVHDNVH
jgi:hypothetical protein